MITISLVLQPNEWDAIIDMVMVSLGEGQGNGTVAGLLARQIHALGHRSDSLNYLLSELGINLPP